MQDHITVLKHEAVEALNIRPDSVIVDATVGAHGHTREILQRLDTHGVFIGFDRDPRALIAEKDFKTSATVYLKVCNFRDIDSILDALGIPSADGILADLGWRMEQFSGGGKGFSFLIDEPLIMTYGKPEEYPFVARDVVNEWEEEDLKNVLRGYGEERFAGSIARAIVKARTKTPITHSLQLAEIVTDAVPGFYKKGKTHPATKTFQALRIVVNDELDALQEFIEKSVRRLSDRGRLAIITFHSLEDRIVKHTLKSFEHDHYGAVLTKKPITPTHEELQANPRARSAKLRIFERHESA